MLVLSCVMKGNRHDEAGYREQSQYLDLWKGNLAGALSKAVDTSQLNSFLVAMAPLGNFSSTILLFLIFSQAVAAFAESNQKLLAWLGFTNEEWEEHEDYC